MTRFTGFDIRTVRLLAELPDWSAEDYAAHKAVLTAGLSRPGLALITELAARFDGRLTVTPRSSVSPLHRDLRFAKPGTPRYKDHLLMTAWEGDDRRAAPTMWLRLDARTTGFASGVSFTPELRDRWRTLVGREDGAPLAALLERLAAHHGAEVASESVKRVPAPFAADHPRADLLRRTGFQVRFAAPHPASLTDADYVDWCLEHWNALRPVHRWLVDHLASGTA
ncbi:MAG: DUF2461 family protein [Thermoleophilia bacterium]